MENLRWWNRRVLRSCCYPNENRSDEKEAFLQWSAECLLIRINPVSKAGADLLAGAPPCPIEQGGMLSLKNPQRGVC
jgi:hypothetical protein